MNINGVGKVPKMTGRVNISILSLQMLLHPKTGSVNCQPQYDFYSRYFAPWVGIPEDPVTGKMTTVTTVLTASQIVFFSGRPIFIYI